MSFTKNLWGKQDFLHTRFKKHMDCYSNILAMIGKYKDGVKEFAKTLKWINDKNYQVSDQSNSTLSLATESLKTSMMSQFRLLTESCEYFEKSIIDPSKIQIDKMNANEYKKYNDIKKALTKFNNAENANNKAKQKFYSAAKIAETAKIDAEVINNGMGNALDKEKSLAKADAVIASAKDLEKAYIATLKIVNDARKEYIDKVTVGFEFYELSEKEYSDGITQTLILYTAGIKKMQYEQVRTFETVELTMKKLNIENDLQEFLKEHQTDAKPPGEIPYEPYNIMMSVDNTTYKQEIIIAVINAFHNNFTDIYKDWDPEMEKEKLVITQLCKRIFTSNINFHFDPEDMKKLFDGLQKELYRKTFLHVLNKQRLHGKFFINKELFDYLVKIITYILDESKEVNDFECPQYCIILAQTFHITNEQDEKYYLINKINQHPLLTSVKFWDELIEMVIQIEREKQYKLSTSDEEVAAAMGNIVFSQLLPYSNNMLEFKIEKEEIKALVERYALKYSLDPSLKDIIIKNIDDVTNEMNK